jgi:DNA-binding transcriptional MerR regulator
MKTLFTPLDVQKVTGLSYRQLQYWDRSGFISPSVRTGGNYRRYTFDDLVLLELIKILKDHHFSVQKLRDLFAKIRAMMPHVDAETGSLSLFMEGDRIMVFTGDTVFESHLDKRTIRFSVKELRNKVNQVFPPAAAKTARQSAAC